MSSFQSNVHKGGADKSLARSISRCILFYSENISFDANLVIYINSTNIPPIMIINRIYENQNLLLLQLVSLLVGLRTYQHLFRGLIKEYFFTSVLLGSWFVADMDVQI